MIITFRSKKNVKIKMLALFYLFITIAFLIFVLQGTRRHGGSLQSNILETLGLASIIILCILILPAIWIRKKSYLILLKLT